MSRVEIERLIGRVILENRWRFTRTDLIVNEKTGDVSVSAEEEVDWGDVITTLANAIEAHQ